MLNNLVSRAPLLDEAFQAPQVRIDFGAFVAPLRPALQRVAGGLHQGDRFGLVQANAMIWVLVRHCAFSLLAAGWVTELCNRRAPRVPILQPRRRFCVLRLAREAALVGKFNNMQVSG